MMEGIVREPKPRHTITRDEWVAEGTRRFGPDMMKWKFVCPSCKHVAAASDWRDAKAPENTVAFSCVGRWSGANVDAFTHKKGGPCNYAGGGLFRINPTCVDHDGVVHDVFAFADEPTA